MFCFSQRSVRAYATEFVTLMICAAHASSHADIYHTPIDYGPLIAPGCFTDFQIFALIMRFLPLILIFAYDTLALLPCFAAMLMPIHADAAIAMLPLP